MKKYPSSFKVLGYLAEKLKTVKDEPMVLAEGMLYVRMCKYFCECKNFRVNTLYFVFTLEMWIYTHKYI